MLSRTFLAIALGAFCGAAYDADASAKSLPGPSTAPQILSGKILTPTINVARAPAAPEITVKFQTGSSGLSFISAQFASSTSTQYQLLTYITPSAEPPVTHGTLLIQRVGGSFAQGAFNLYSAAGTWTLTSLGISDRNGNSTSYNQTQLAAKFPSLTIDVVNKGTPDIAAPMVTAGQILTPGVHLSSAYPSFGASLTVSDNISGVQYGLITVKPPSGNTSYGANQGAAAPVKNGTIKVYVNLGSSGQTGTWTITQFGVCDVAGNCRYDVNPSDIQALFGTTTFNVGH